MTWAVQKIITVLKYLPIEAQVLVQMCWAIQSLEDEKCEENCTLMLSQ